VLFGDVLHHISLSSSTHTHPFEEREKPALKNESKEVTAKSAKASAAPVLSPEFPVSWCTPIWLSEQLFGCSPGIPVAVENSGVGSGRPELSSEIPASNSVRLDLLPVLSQ